MSMQWLLDRAPGFRDLPAEDREEILAFTLLWALFEAQVMDNVARIDTILRKIDEWNEADAIDADAYNEVLAYFRQRYFPAGIPSHHFDRLNLRPADQPDLVISVLDGRNNLARDRVVAVLVVVWRYRNNLFHGEKWAYGLAGQLENFRRANSVLTRLLERYGRHRA